MSAERLIKEFGAQDVGAWLTVFREGVHTRVAQWNNDNQCWNVLPAGHAMLNPPSEEELAAEAEEKPRKRGFKPPPPVEKVGLSAASNLSLD